MHIEHILHLKSHISFQIWTKQNDQINMKIKEKCTRVQLKHKTVLPKKCPLEKLKEEEEEGDRQEGEEEAI